MDYIDIEIGKAKDANLYELLKGTVEKLPYTNLSELDQFILANIGVSCQDGYV